MKRTKTTIRLLAAAERDFADIIDYVLAENPLAAMDIAERIEKNLLNLQANPQLGRIPDDEQLLRMGYRYLIVLDFLIFYKIEEQTILIYRIIDGARNYKDLL